MKMFCCTSKRLILVVVLGLAIILGLAELFRWQIILGYAPFLFVLLCPLMHLLGGHGGHRTNQEQPHTRKVKPSCH